MTEDGDREYRAAVEGLALFEHGTRTRLAVSGRAPRQMLNGVLTGTLPAPPSELEPGVLAGAATYHAVLTPKGKMITDLWAFLIGDEEIDGFLLDVPEAGSPPLREHLGKVLPPRLARVEDVTERTDMLAVTGPEAAGALSRLAAGLRVEAEQLSRLEEGAWRRVGAAGQGVGRQGLTIERTRDVPPEAYRVLGDRDSIRALRERLVEAGAVAAGAATWTTLRLEAGRPAFGVDMTQDTIPIEAGIHDRAIDYGKGCYTGQEVIVRIRDRGHVNRHLRRLALGEGPVPAAGAELHGTEDGGKAVGWITSAARSPGTGEVVALAYVRRGVERVVLDGREIGVGVP